MESAVRSRLLSTLRFSALPALAALVLVLTAPWGDYPLNDDWQYSRVAKRFAETGRFLVDVPVAPSLAVQSLAATPVVRALGFSHVSLRLLTFAVALSSLWAIGRLLLLAGLSWRVRFLAQALLLLNPLFLNVSLSFMTEVWGLAPALLGATVWFSERRRALAPGHGPETAMRPWPVALAALLVALGFWSRQHAAVAFPALVGSLVLPRLGRPRALRSLLASRAVLLGLLVFAAGVAAWAPWVRASGNLRAEFSGPLRGLLAWDARAWLLALGALPFYLTAFLLPLLLLLPWKGIGTARAAVASTAVLAFAALGAWSFLDLSAPDFETFHYQHRIFPFLPNVIFNAGVGPVTLAEVFFDGRPPAQLGQSLWVSIEVLLGLACVLWVPLLGRSRSTQPPEGEGIRTELSAFGFLWAAGTTVLVVQAHQIQLFDRYFLPVAVGLLLVAAAAIRPARPSPWRLAASLAALAPLAFFTVAGTHDYFRWNDARWSAVRALLHDGVSPTVIQGGYEVNGWLAFDDFEAGREPVGCIGPCACSVRAPNWNCLDDSYRVAMYALPGYEAIATRPVRGWLAEWPPILTLRRFPHPPGSANGSEGAPRVPALRPAADSAAPGVSRPSAP